MNEDQAWDDGFDAYNNGKKIADNPFPVDSDEIVRANEMHLSWIEGFEFAKDEDEKGPYDGN